jgi:radical SAM superfamily enzyme YgiQ (UPF0313 family)
MKICLVMPLSVSDFVDVDATIDAQSDATAPHLGILALAAMLRQQGFEPSVLNLNELFIAFIVKSRANGSARDQGDPIISRVISSSRPAGDGTFLDFVCEQLDSSVFDVLGIGSICSSYPLSLRIAERIKARRPNVPIILGGPQASVVDVATLETFASVDYILRGEADASLPQLLRILSGESAAAMESVGGLTYRRNGTVHRSPAAPLMELDDLPLPAFDLDPYAGERKRIYLELGRGCPFACTFCSTNDFFRRNFRLKSTDKLIKEMVHVGQTYNLRHFDLVHDMYTVNRRKVVEFCEALLTGGHNFRWGCSARTDCVDDRLLALMADAGCAGIFFGIETGSARMQHVIKKKLDLTEATRHIAATDVNGISMAVALIIGFPDETRDDLGDSIHYFINARRFDNAQPQMGLLAPLAETPIESEFRDQLVFDEIFSSMSYQGWQWNEGDIELIKAHPRIFSNFYAVPTKWVLRDYLSKLLRFTASVTRQFRWLAIGLVRDSGDFLSVFDQWLACHPSEPIKDGDEHYVPYHLRSDFTQDFLEFVETIYVPAHAHDKAAILALVTNERAIVELKQSVLPEAKATPDTAAAPAEDNTKHVVELAFNTVPKPAKYMRLVKLGVDYEELLACLRGDKALSSVRRREVMLSYRVSDAGEIEVHRLSPLSAALLGICDGAKPVRELIAHPEWQESLPEAISSEQATFFGLKQLCEQSLLAV